MDFSQGKIYLDPAFRYPASTVPCDKLLVILNANHKPPENLIVVPVTTNRVHKDLGHGCHEQYGMFHIQKKIGFFDEGTLVQLKSALPFDYEWFCKRIKNNEVYTKDHYSTSKQEIQGILSCLKRLKEDVPEFFWQYL